MNSFKLFELKRKLDVFCPIEIFFELHSSPRVAEALAEAQLRKEKREDRTLRKQPVAVFSDGARWRKGSEKRLPKLRDLAN